MTQGGENIALVTPRLSVIECMGEGRMMTVHERGSYDDITHIVRCAYVEHGTNQLIQV